MMRLALRARDSRAVNRGDSDEELMLRYRAGEVRAFEILVTRHERGVFNFLRRSVQNEAHAEDLLQEVFLRVVKGAEGYQQHAKLTTWLYTIARNLCVDASRRAKHRRAVSLDEPRGRGDGEEGATLLSMTADTSAAVDRRAIGTQLAGRMEVAIARLPDDQREVFLLREVHGLPFQEIAAIVGCPENTVKSRMRYALEKLRAELEDYSDMARALP